MREKVVGRVTECGPTWAKVLLEDGRKASLAVGSFYPEPPFRAPRAGEKIIGSLMPGTVQCLRMGFARPFRG